MPWNDGLAGKQLDAAGHAGSPARLLAGPGTGKTFVMTRRICYLIEAGGFAPEEIRAITFTRAAARELRQRVREEVGEDRLPRISTLHSFALRQLLKNSRKLSVLPQPLRIADDWEERNIVIEDIKAMLSLSHIKDARELLNQLSADWQSLTADEADRSRRFANPRFLGAWQQHRQVYGYTLRAELVYQLKHALEEIDDFELEGPPAHLLVDEYQDLNRCDLEVVRQVAERGAELYVAGDDDQSIYGFRMAHPEGIRRFPEDYTGTELLDLDICRRCDPEILELGLFVAEQDFQRLPKPIRAEDGREGGEVAIVRFPDGGAEANGIAQICRYLLDEHELNPQDILILLRSDRHGVFSGLIVDSLDAQGIPASVATPETNPLETAYGRQVLAFFRLMANREDHLAWRTLLQLRKNGLGAATISELYHTAVSDSTGFANTVAEVADNPHYLSRFGGRLENEFGEISGILDELAPDDEDEKVDVEKIIETLVERVVEHNDDAEAIESHLSAILHELDAESISDLVGGLEASSEDIEQDLAEEEVNILTMHKAKGLTAEAVIIAVAEDQYIPGIAQGEAIGDERRLLYVSLTRAKHHLFVTYCNRRTGRQAHSGRTAGSPRRTLTQFLRNAPKIPVPSASFLRDLAEHDI